MHYFSSDIPLEEGDDSVATLRRRRPQDVRIDEADEVVKCKRIDRDNRHIVAVWNADEDRQNRIRKYTHRAAKHWPLADGRTPMD